MYSVLLASSTLPITVEDVYFWGCPLNPFTYDRVYLPVNIDNLHWALLEISHSQRSIHYLDGMRTPPPNLFLQRARSWLQAAAALYHYEVPIELYTEDAPIVPLQTDSFSCGVFLLAFAVALSAHPPQELAAINPSPHAMNRLRISITQYIFPSPG